LKKWRKRKEFDKSDKIQSTKKVGCIFLCCFVIQNLKNIKGKYVKRKKKQNGRICKKKGEY